MSLTNVGANLGAAGRHDESLTALEDAAGIYRRLAAANPASYEADLSDVLDELTIVQRQARRAESTSSVEATARRVRRWIDRRR